MVIFSSNGKGKFFDLESWRKAFPKPPYKDIQDAARQIGICSSGKWKPGWPCIECNGSGRIIDPEAVGDVVEGHKFSRRIDCPDCKGSGAITEKAFKAWFDGVMGKWKEDIKARRMDEKILKILNRKLSIQEATAISNYALEAYASVWGL